MSVWNIRLPWNGVWMHVDFPGAETPEDAIRALNGSGYNLFTEGYILEDGSVHDRFLGLDPLALGGMLADFNIAVGTIPNLPSREFMVQGFVSSIWGDPEEVRDTAESIGRDLESAMLEPDLRAKGQHLHETLSALAEELAKPPMEGAFVVGEHRGVEE